MALVHVIAGSHFGVSILQFDRIFRVYLEVIKLPLARKIDQAKHLAADLQCQSVRPERTPLRSKRKSQSHLPYLFNIHNLDADGGFDGGVGVVVLYVEIFVAEVEDGGYFRIDHHPRQGARIAL